MTDDERGASDGRRHDRERERGKRPRSKSRHKSRRRCGDAGGNHSSSDSSSSSSRDRHRRRHKSSESRSRSRRRDEKKKRGRKKSRRGDRDSVRDDDGSSGSASSESSASSRERTSIKKKSRKKERDRRDRKERPGRKKEHRSDDRDRKKKKKSKKDKKKHKKSNRSLSSSSSASKGGSEGDKRTQEEEQSTSPPSRGELFSDALHSLLDEHPALATDLPYMLIRMAGGTGFDLGQMTNVSAAGGLRRVFEELKPFGVQRDETGSWTWRDQDGGGMSRGSSSGGRKPHAELVLVKISRALLDGVGVTVEAVEEFERGPPVVERKAKTESLDAAVNEGAVHSSDDQKKDNTRDLRLLIHALFDKFQSKPGGESLPSELGGVFDTISQGESVALDGIPDEELRSDLENMFLHLGLVKSEIEEEEDSDEEVDDGETNGEGGAGEVAMGYGLPEDGETEYAVVEKKVCTVLEECKQRQSGATSADRDSIRLDQQKVAGKRRPVQGPAMGPPPGGAAAYYPPVESSSEDEGPAPIGSEAARKRRQTPSSEVVRAMAEQRRLQLADVAAGGDGTELSAAVAGGREEWMIIPGEHDFLKGIKSGGGLKNRTFKNEKTRGGEAAAEAPMNPQVRAEIEAISKAHAEARGPSLMDDHRRKKAEEKEAELQKGGTKEWKWSRDEHLDEGRRVDKNNLNMIMGGASSNLKEKFQGSFSKGFT